VLSSGLDHAALSRRPAASNAHLSNLRGWRGERNDFGRRFLLLFEWQRQRPIFLPGAVALHPILQLLPQMLRESGRTRRDFRTPSRASNLVIAAPVGRSSSRLGSARNSALDCSRRGKRPAALLAASLPFPVVMPAGVTSSAVLLPRGFFCHDSCCHTFPAEPA